MHPYSQAKHSRDEQQVPHDRPPTEVTPIRKTTLAKECYREAHALEPIAVVRVIGQNIRDEICKYADRKPKYARIDSRPPRSTPSIFQSWDLFHQGSPAQFGGLGQYPNDHAPMAF